MACVGNVLRGDDGFGPAVAERLGKLGGNVDVVETGIGGVALVGELLGGGYDGLVMVDAVDQGAAPGTVMVIDPEIVAEEGHVADVHLANPERVLAMVKAMDALPPRVAIVGCQPVEVDELESGLSPPVAGAVDAAAAKVRETVDAWLRQS